MCVQILKCLPQLSHIFSSQHFKIVAVIADATPATTHIQLTLEDSTGQCNLKEWNNKSELEWAQHKEQLT